MTAATTTTMTAVVQDGYGDADVLRCAQVERPTAGDGRVLVRVHAAGVTRGVWHVMTGTPYAVRLALGLRRPRQPVVGLELAGTVVATGAGVTRFAPGDEVFGTGTGAFAEYALAREERLAHKPATLTLAEAAVVPDSGVTALQALTDVGHVRAGQRVLVTGASGGVGSFAVQIATAFGAHVTAECTFPWRRAWDSNPRTGGEPGQRFSRPTALPHLTCAFQPVRDEWGTAQALREAGCVGGGSSARLHPPGLGRGPGRDEWADANDQEAPTCRPDIRGSVERLLRVTTARQEGRRPLARRMTRARRSAPAVTTDACTDPPRDRESSPSADKACGGGSS